MTTHYYLSTLLRLTALFYCLSVGNIIEPANGFRFIINNNKRHQHAMKNNIAGRLSEISLEKTEKSMLNELLQTQQKKKRGLTFINEGICKVNDLRAINSIYLTSTMKNSVDLSFRGINLNNLFQSSNRVSRSTTRLFMSESLTEAPPSISTTTNEDISLVISYSNPVSQSKGQNDTHINGYVNGKVNGDDVASPSETDAPDISSELKNDVPLPTENGGFSHTTASRAKISAANKGKVPWNKGKTRSEETRARISAGVRARNRKIFLQKLEDLGLTEEEYEQQKREERNRKERERKARKTANGGYTPTQETKEKISRILKEKYKNGEIKRKSRKGQTGTRTGIKHSQETKDKISASLKARWSGDEGYRRNIKDKVARANSSEEVKKRISKTLKEKWQDPEFRAYMMERITKRKLPENQSRDADYRRKISETMKKKWEDPEYRAKAMKSMAAKASSKPSSSTKKKKKTTKKVSSKKSKTKKKKKNTKSKSKVTEDGVVQISSITALTPDSPVAKPKRKTTRKKKKSKSKTTSSTKKTKKKTKSKKKIDDNAETTDPDSIIGQLDGSIPFQTDDMNDFFDDDDDDFDFDGFDPYGLE